MKVTESTDKPDGKGNILYYSIRTDEGTNIGSAFININPLGSDPEITLEDAKKNATLWASASDLLEALEECVDIMDNLEKAGNVGFTHSVMYRNAKAAIKRAKGL